MPRRRLNRRLLGLEIVVVVALFASFSLPWFTWTSVESQDGETITPYLSFDFRAFSTNRKVFAHYVPHFPISIDNLPTSEDYYATEYLYPRGEGGIHAAYGGLVRDRPLPRAPIPSPDWRNQDLRTEIRQAKSVGIDGFAVDIIVTRAESMVPMAMMSAAQSAGDFSIFVTADMAGPLQSLGATEFADEFADYLRAPTAFRLSDGRPVLGAFLAEKKPVEWWSEVLSNLNTRHNIGAAFVPTFLDAAGNIDAFAPISYGFSYWGGRNPRNVPTVAKGPNYPVDLAQRSHNLGKIWMQPIAYQDNRPREGTFEESENGVTSRQAWQVAIAQGAEWTQLVTWNDYAEMTAFAPSIKHGWGLLDMNAFGIAFYKYGVPPTIVRDAIYISYRTQPFSAFPTFPETKLMQLVPETTPARDAVELVTFAVSASTLKVDIGNSGYSCEIPPGLGVCTFPLQLGWIVASMWRDGRRVAVSQSPLQVSASPYVQDLQYAVSGGLR